MGTTRSRTESGSRRPRGSITPEEIVSAAFEVANASSLSQFSMPVLAKHLGVGVTSIYWHFRKKEDLLDAMTARASAEYLAATPAIRADNWKDALRKHFRRMRHTFRAQPVLVELTLLRGRPGPFDATSIHATADKLDSLLTAMVDAGFTRASALEVYLSLLAHVCGAAMIEHQGVFSGDATDPIELADAAPLVRELSARGYRVDDVEGATFDYTFEAILRQAETMIEDRH